MRKKNIIRLVDIGKQMTFNGYMVRVYNIIKKKCFQCLRKVNVLDFNHFIRDACEMLINAQLHLLKNDKK